MRKKIRLEETFEVHVPHVPVKSFHEELLHNLPKDWGKVDCSGVPFLLFPVVSVNSWEFIVKGYKILRWMMQESWSKATERGVPEFWPQMRTPGSQHTPNSLPWCWSSVKQEGNATKSCQWKGQPTPPWSPTLLGIGLGGCQDHPWDDSTH